MNKPMDMPPQVIGRREPAAFTPSLFQSFFMGGFECATHRRKDGRRLDLIAATGHDRVAAGDYRRLLHCGIGTARDGLRWHLIETKPGRYDWSSFLPMLHAARDVGIEVLWDLCHWGWPDDIDIWSPAFPDRFARFAKAAAALVRNETDGVPFYCAINEISYWAWSGGDTGHMNPCVKKRGPELKEQLIRASVAAIDAIRSVEPRARFIQAEPVINIVPHPNRPQDRAAAEGHRLSQFEVWDMLAGRMRPDLGGSPDCLDIVGVNFYVRNQWIHNHRTIGISNPLYKPFREVLQETSARCHRPILVTETGIEKKRRHTWLQMIGRETRAAMAAGIPVEGICWYPVIDYPGWDNERHCPTGLFGYLDETDERPLHEPLAVELRRQQALFADRFGARVPSLPLGVANRAYAAQAILEEGVS